MNRSGTVLVFALLAVLAMELVALSAFGFARIARLGALHEQEHARLQAAADDVLASAAASLDARDAAARPAGQPWTLSVGEPLPGGTTAVVTVHRLSDMLLLLDVSLRSGSGAAAHARALLRILPPDLLMQGFPAVVSTALPPGPGGVPEATDTSSCGSSTGLPGALLPWTSRAWSDSLPFGHAAATGWGDLDALHAAAAVIAAAGDSVRFTLARGDTVLSGVHTGVLAVDGDLRLTPGSLVRGMLVVRGVLTIESGARVEGVARALALQDEGGTFRYDRCATASALDAAPFRRVYRPGVRWRLPAF